MKRNMLRSLRFKINAAIFSACLIVGIFFVSVFYPLEVNWRHSRLHEINVLMSAVYEQKKEELANEIFAKQEQALSNTLMEIQRVKGISDISIYSKSGELLRATGLVIRPYLASKEMRNLEESPSFERGILNGDPIAEFSTVIEVIGERVGYIKIRYSLERMEKESLLAVWILSALLLSTLIIMAVLLNYLLSRSVLRPVSILSDAMTKLKSGQLGEQVVLDSRDEIGKMATAFNEMSEKIKNQHRELERSIEARNSYAEELEKSYKALEELNARLEDMVCERTAELRKSNEQLQQEINERMRADEAKKELEERLARSQKMEALGLLAGGVAHDLNNVLCGTVSYPDLLLMELPPDSPMRKPIETIRESGCKAAAIVQDLLTLARRGITQTSVMNLNDEIIREYLESPEHLKLAQGHENISIETFLDEDLLNIRGSSVHLKKTVMNLVINAIEAQPYGGRIIISTANRYVDKPIQGYDSVKEGDYVVLKISDRGVGIAEEDIKRIFEPFYTKKVMGRSGTGLGMAVVWGTMQDHNGYIHVKSSPGNGTTFELFFPVTRDETPQLRKSVPVEDYLGNKEKILVIDDIEEQREIAVRILKKLNYEAVAVAGGEEAVEYLRKNSADLLLLDMIMDPGIDGLETYRKVIKLHPGQKAVIASGFAENSRVREAQKLGVGRYIKKPYTIENLGIAIKEQFV